MSAHKILNDLYVKELQDLKSANNQVVKAIKEMALRGHRRLGRRGRLVHN